MASRKCEDDEAFADLPGESLLARDARRRDRRCRTAAPIMSAAMTRNEAA
jgi:hypothetical protein